MSRFRHPGFWILLAIGLLDILIVMAPVTSLGILFCLLFYPASIGRAGRWLTRFHDEIGGPAQGG